LAGHHVRQPAVSVIFSPVSVASRSILFAEAEK